MKIFFANAKFFGIFITFLGGVFWGFSGVCGQYLFEYKSISANWLVPYRLLCAGVILVLYYAFTKPKILFLPLKDTKNLPNLLIYAILGLMMTQYSYFYSIQLSNAAVATVIQYSAPAMILAIACFLDKRLPSVIELIALILAMLGVVVIATHGHLDTLVISKKALAFCLLSAACVCVYNFVPKKLNQKYPVGLVLGWGLIIGGVVLAVFTNVWKLQGVYDLSGYLAVLGVITLGTVFAFSFYMLGVKLIGASRASLIAAIEPASAAFFAHFWLGTKFAFLDFVGFVLIMSCIILLAKKGV